MVDKTKMGWIVREIEQRFGTDAPYIVLVQEPDTLDVNVSSNLDVDDLIALLVKTAEHVEANGPELEGQREG